MGGILIAAFFLLLAQAGPPPQASVQNITLSFLTQKNAKPWNAQVRGKLLCGGQVLATLNCCSGNKKEDRWAVGSNHLRDMRLAQPLPREALTGCTLDLGMDAPGGSRWTVSPSVTVVYSNSHKRQRSFDLTTLVSKGSYVSKQFGLDLYPWPNSSAKKDFHSKCAIHTPVCSTACSAP